VHVQGKRGFRPDFPHKQHAERYCRDELPVHHVEMKRVNAGSLSGGNRLTHA
jgi:hypothetical protein